MLVIYSISVIDELIKQRFRTETLESSCRFLVAAALLQSPTEVHAFIFQEFQLARKNWTFNTLIQNNAPEINFSGNGNIKASLILSDSHYYSGIDAQ